MERLKSNEDFKFNKTCLKNKFLPFKDHRKIDFERIKFICRMITEEVGLVKTFRLRTEKIRRKRGEAHL